MEKKKFRVLFHFAKDTEQNLHSFVSRNLQEIFAQHPPLCEIKYDAKNGKSTSKALNLHICEVHRRY